MKRDRAAATAVKPSAPSKIVEVQSGMTLKDLAGAMGIKAKMVQAKLRSMGENVRGGMSTKLSADACELAVLEFQMECVVLDEPNIDIVPLPLPEDPSTLPDTRAPIVAVMGHIDAGKTTLLDSLRGDTDVAAGEAGGITQHVSACEVALDGQAYVFIDTPGHAAFSTLRQRGGSMANLVLLIVDPADFVNSGQDGGGGTCLQPQTKEAMEVAQHAGLPVIVVMNKVDNHPPHELELAEQKLQIELSAHNMLVEKMGGTTQLVRLSALKNIGVDALREAIAMDVELIEDDLRCDYDAPGEAIVLEAMHSKAQVSCFTFTVTFHANPAHDWTRPPSYI